MNESQIAVRYAKALFQVARDQKILDQVSRDMEMLTDTCRVEDFMYMLALPSLQASQKRKIIDSVLKERISESSMSMIHLVIRNKREIYLPGIARNFMDFYRDARGITAASLVTASEVKPGVADKMRKMVSDAFGSEVDMQTSVDHKLIGGFTLTVKDQRYDASVASSLRKMKSQLLQTRIEKK